MREIVNTKFVLVLLLACICSGIAHAETQFFLVTDESEGHLYDRYVRYKDATIAPTGLYVQLCVSGHNGTYDYAAPTNFGWAPKSNNGYAFTNYLPAACCEYQVGDCRLGDDDGGLGLTVKPGSVSASLGSADETRYGWLRFFSGREITNSAYYGDALGDDVNRRLDDPAGFAGNWDADPIINLVNPAYEIPFSVDLPGNYDVSAQSPYLAEGWVKAGIGNNILEASVLTVVWYNVSLNTQGVCTVSTYGDWTTGVIISNRTAVSSFTNEIQFYAVAASPREGLPISETITRYVIGVPEPGTFLLIGILMCIVRRNHLSNLHHI